MKPREKLNQLLADRLKYIEYLRTVNTQMLLSGKSHDLARSRIELRYLLARVNAEIRTYVEPPPPSGKGFSI